MHGANIGSLEVLLVSQVGSTIIWREDDNLWDAWLPASVDIISDYEYQVIVTVFK